MSNDVLEPEIVMDMAFGAGIGESVGHAMNTPDGGQSQSLKEVERVRSEFPETWLWENATVGYGVSSSC